MGGQARHRISHAKNSNWVILEFQLQARNDRNRFDEHCSNEGSRRNNLHRNNGTSVFDSRVRNAASTRTHVLVCYLPSAKRYATPANNKLSD